MYHGLAILQSYVVFSSSSLHLLFLSQLGKVKLNLAQLETIIPVKKKRGGGIMHDRVQIGKGLIK